MLGVESSTCFKKRIFHFSLQHAAKMRAERKFANILKGAGVDENFVVDRGDRYQPDKEAPDTYTEEFSDKGQSYQIDRFEFSFCFLF